MTFETCATLAQIFPIFLVGLVIESARVSSVLRRMGFFRNGVLIFGVSCAFLGFFVVLLGLQTHGLSAGPATAAWILFALTVLMFVFELISILASQEYDDDSLVAIETEESRLLSWLERDRP